MAGKAQFRPPDDLRRLPCVAGADCPVSANTRVPAVAGPCSPMGCTLKWNNAQTRRDGSCHGGRFAPDGRVLEGPAPAPSGAATLAPVPEAPA